MLGTNTFIIGTGAKKILIDAGEGIKRYIDELVQCVEQLQCVIITHHHIDHIGGIADILNAYGQIPIYKYKTPGDSEIFQHIAEGQQISTESCTLTVLETPGHSSDHICLYLSEEKAIFTGDIILGTGSTLLTNYSDYLTSMNKLLQLNAEILYPAHGESKVSANKISEDLAHRRYRETQILEVLTGEMDLQEITRKVYGELRPELQMAAENNARLYLEHLRQSNLVSEISGKWLQIRSY